MFIHYWLCKTEPEEYSYEDLINEKETCWSGVRNYEARNYLRRMKIGDAVLFYYSGKKRAVIALTEVSSDPYPDPTDFTKNWSAINLRPKRSLAAPVSLNTIKQHHNLQNCLLVKRSRLSVMPLTKTEFLTIIKLSECNS